MNERKNMESCGWLRALGKGNNLAYIGNELTHYTTLDGLLGIVNNNGFWLSDHRFLNDEEEFENGRNLAIKILGKLISTNRYVLFRKILELVLFDLKNHAEMPYFICSFSTKKDCLDLWKWYSKSEIGISIVLDTKFDAPESHFGMIPIVMTSKVVYNDRTKCKIILNDIRNFYKEFIIDFENDQKRVEREDLVWSSALMNQLIFNFINFKHAEFESESELRIVVSAYRKEEYNLCLHHRVKDKIIPYIDIGELYKKYNLGQLPIKEIIISPNCKEEIVKKSLEEYLKSKSYNDVRVSFSKIPFRG